MKSGDEGRGGWRGGGRSAKKSYKRTERGRERRGEELPSARDLTRREFELATRFNTHVRESLPKVVGGEGGEGITCARPSRARHGQ